MIITNDDNNMMIKTKASLFAGKPVDFLVQGLFLEFLAGWGGEGKGVLERRGGG